MPSVVYPSPAVPGPIQVSVEVPADWVTEAAPGVAFVAASPTEIGGVHTNIVLSVRRIDAELGLDQVAEMVAEELASLPTCTEPTVGHQRIGDRDCAVLSYQFDGPEAGSSIYQIQAVCVAQVTERLSDAVTLTLTHGTGIDSMELDSLREIIASMRVG